MIHDSKPWRIVGALATTAILLAPLAAAQKGTAVQSVDLGLAFAEDGSATATVYQTWNGPDARSFRQSLDVYFGASDGILTEDELVRIAQATQADMQNQKLPWLSTGGAAWVVTNVAITFENAAGRVSSTQPVSMRHEIVLATGSSQLVETVDIDAPWDASLATTLPEGKAVEGGAPAMLAKDTRASLMIVDAAPAPIPEEATSEETGSSSKGLFIGLMALGGVVLLMVLAAAGYLLYGRKKRAAS